MARRVHSECVVALGGCVTSVAGGSQTPRLPCSTCSPQVVSHFLGDTALNSEYSQNLQASLQSIQRAMEHTQITGREANAQSHASERAQTHTHTAASAARIQTCVHPLRNDPSGTLNVPMQRLI